MGFEPPVRTRGILEANGKTSLSAADAATTLTRTDTSWASTPGTAATVTYAYRDSGTPSDSTTSGFSEFTAAQITVADQMFQAWSDVANIHFVRVGSGTGAGAYSDNATILLGNFTSGGDNTAGYTEYPGSTDPSSPNGDVWINGALSYETAATLTNYGAHTLLHEIGHSLGLSHPSDYDASDATQPTYANSAAYYEDSAQYSVMSYFEETETGADYFGAYAASPMLDDISAAQLLYGANMTTRTGDTVYGFNSTAGRPWFDAANGPLVFAAWDAGGTDTFDFSGYTQNQKIDLRQGQFSDVGGLTGNVAVAYGTVIENAIGGSGNDVIIGNSANNVLQGGAGNDTLYGAGGTDTLLGGAGDDTIDGSVGYDTIDGGAGNDTLLLSGVVTDYTALQNAAGTWTVQQIYGGTDTVTNIESVNVGGTVMTWAAFTQAAFDGLRYIASYSDLIVALGANAAAGVQHYKQYGAHEGRTITFDPVEYAASNLDVYRALGLSYTALESHYITYGYYEHRQVAGFNALEYIASNADLIRAFGADAHAGALHYLDYGIAEGRQTTSFDPERYLLANPDLYGPLGNDPTALTLHYINAGEHEGRATATVFDPLVYGASNPDLIAAFGTDTTALTLHWLQHGGFEGRAIDSFDPWGYAVANPDLYAAFGVNVDELAAHYIVFGYNEHRTIGTFDPAIYAASNLDVARAFGGNLAEITAHYLDHGIAEHRAITGFDTLEYAASNPSLITSVSLDPHALALHYITTGLNEGLPTASFDRISYMLSYMDAEGSGPDGALSQYVHGGYLTHTDPDGHFGTDQTSHTLGDGTFINPTTYETSVLSSFETTGDRDWYSISLSGTEKETIWLHGLGDAATSLDTYLWLYDANGNLVTTDDDLSTSDHSSRIDITLAAGTYYIVAGTYADQSSGSYYLGDAATSAPNAAISPAASAPVSNDIKIAPAVAPIDAVHQDLADVSLLASHTAAIAADHIGL